MRTPVFFIFFLAFVLCGKSCKAPDTKTSPTTDTATKQAKNSDQREATANTRAFSPADSAKADNKKSDKDQTQTDKSLAPQDTTALPTLTTDCQNCGMPAEDFPTWRVRAETAKQAHHFCSPKCYFSRQMKPNKAISQVKKVFFKDYYTQTFVEEKNAWFVIKSKITGPMGADLVPFGDEAAAKEFMADHQGKQILRHSEVVEPVLNNLK
jgi:nitrous oxide reductase accessory protein NosL